MIQWFQSTESINTAARTDVSRGTVPELYCQDSTSPHSREIVHEYTDTISGAKSKRPVLTSFLQMPADIASMSFW
jgi:hypothetical protein